MGLFFDILSALNNPHQQGSVDRLTAIVVAAQQLGSSHGLDAATLQTLLSMLGDFLRPLVLRLSLQQPFEQPSFGSVGNGSLSDLIEQASVASNFGIGAQPAFLTPPLQRQLVQTLAQRTGVTVTTLQAALPGLVAIALGFLSLGTGTSGTSGANPVLKAFLHPDRDGSADLGEVFKFAQRLLNP